MTVFALDASGKTASIAIMQNDNLIYESYLANGLTHSETLMPLAENAFKITGLSPLDIQLYAVNAGPGSFTGLRIGMALIKGLAMPHNTPCAGVSTLESMAYTFSGDGRVICALNARREQVYYAVFDIASGVVTRICEDTAAPATQLQQYATHNIYIMGDGANIVQNALNDEFTSKLCSPHLQNARAYGVAVCGARQVPCNATQLEVNYHRLSQAQRQRAEKEKEL